ncbi:MAG: biotin-dependent carboxyltransferase family protein [Candidatus Bathyarchaeota archaeon]|nr:MAG: biotin-dependent carboxyltransferase family protein [Candidatus Bathyarchaeota archaeon]
MRLLKVLKPGFSTTIQDYGRVGYQKYGVPVSGVMDPVSFFTANLLVGNHMNEACLEATVLGPKLRFLNETQIAITGADLSPSINHDDVCNWRTLQVHKNDLLSFGHSRSGCRAYVAVKGGLSIPILMGSRSTCIRAGFGGHQGRPLKAGDVLKFNANSGKPIPILKLPESLIPEYTSKHEADIILGPQDDYFTKESISKFLTGTFTISMDSDRMGYRLEGEIIKYKNDQRMISDAIPVGAVQVPESGKPILMMRDAQTTGGYPKIAVVSTPTIAQLGQAKPNDEITFQQVSPIRAQQSIREYLKSINGIKHTLKKLSSY